MEKLIAKCGLDCAKCEARIATINNDDLLREKVAKQWSEWNKVDITKDMINCLGCNAPEGPKTPFCESLCAIRQCAIKNHFKTCGECKNLNSCDKVSMIISNNKDALDNLTK